MPRYLSDRYIPVCVSIKFSISRCVAVSLSVSLYVCNPDTGSARGVYGVAPWARTGIRSHTHTHTHSLAPTHTHSLSLSHTHTHTPSLSLPLPPSLSLCFVDLFLLFSSFHGYSFSHADTLLVYGDICVHVIHPSFVCFYMRDLAVYYPNV